MAGINNFINTIILFVLKLSLVSFLPYDENQKSFYKNKGVHIIEMEIICIMWDFLEIALTRHIHCGFNNLQQLAVHIEELFCE